MHGISINPVAFIVAENGNIRLMTVENSSGLEKLLDYVPNLVNKFIGKVDKNCNSKTTCFNGTEEKNKKDDINYNNQNNDIEEIYNQEIVTESDGEIFEEDEI